MKNLLIDGMPGCGKTTAISDALRSLGLLPCCAGFRTVRVLKPTGERYGFAQLPASADVGTEVVSEEPLPHMILVYRKQPPLVRETFTGFTVSSLKTITALADPVSLSFPACKGEPGKEPEASAEEIRLILMDEIGGSELEIPVVREAFLEALKGDIPVIGVIKSDEHARKFAYESYREFRTRIENETDTEFLYMNEENRGEVRVKLVSWLLQIS